MLNADDPVCVGLCRAHRGDGASGSAARVTWQPGASLCGDKLVLDGKLLMSAGEIPIRGRHNVENVLAASIAAARAGVTARPLPPPCARFRPSSIGWSSCARSSGIDFYNDSKATSVDATLKALDAFAGGLWVILGGKDKGLDYSLLREPLAAKAHAALLIGAAAGKIADALAGRAAAGGCGHARTPPSRTATATASAGDTVLLAPACASFDQFRSFEHRGEVFKEIVNRLEPKER